jgi:hypothetical protein
MKDILFGYAVNFTFEKMEAFAVSTVWCGFTGHKVMFVSSDLSRDDQTKLIELGFEVRVVPKLLAEITHKFFHYVNRFLVIHRYLLAHAGEFRFAFCADTRDLIFQGNPSKWMEQNIGEYKLVAASEFCAHVDSPPNMMWIDGMLPELREWMAPKMIYCSGFVSGRAEYISDLAAGIYLYAREFTTNYWGPDQPIYATIMHQKAYADITLVPKAEDYFCINCVNIAHDNLIQVMSEYPPVRPFYDFNPRHTMNQNILWNNGIPNLSEFCVLHQYDRIPPLADNIKRVFTLENLRAGCKPFRIETTKFPSEVLE